MGNSRGIFERVQFLETRLDRLETIILRQDAMIQAQTEALGREVMPAHTEPGTRRISDIVAEIARDNGLTLAEIKYPTKVASVCEPRQYAFAKVLDAGFSSKAVARFFGMDHTTVISGAKTARAKMDKAPAL